MFETKNFELTKESKFLFYVSCKDHSTQKKIGK